MGRLMTDEELIECASDFRDGILAGDRSDMKCAMVCWPLAGLLQSLGVKCDTFTTDAIKTKYGSVNHVWIGLQDGRVLDPTADQFNDLGLAMPKVYLGPKVRKLHRASRVQS